MPAKKAVAKVQIPPDCEAVSGVVIFMQYNDAVGDDSIPPSGVDCRRRQDAQLLPTDSQ